MTKIQRYLLIHISDIDGVPRDNYLPEKEYQIGQPEEVSYLFKTNILILSKVIISWIEIYQYELVRY